MDENLRKAMLGDVAQREWVQGHDEVQALKDAAFNLAFEEANKWGISSILAAAIATVATNNTSPRFRKYMGLSAKASIPVMVGMFVWSVKFELTVLDAIRDPESWGLVEETDKGLEVKKFKTAMPIHHQAMNYAYDNPFTMIVGLGVPFASLILRQNLKLKHLTLSQKIMHSRVYAQAGVLTIALSTLAFRDYMRIRGRFTEPDN